MLVALLDCIARHFGAQIEALSKRLAALEPHGTLATTVMNAVDEAREKALLIQSSLTRSIGEVSASIEAALAKIELQ